MYSYTFQKPSAASASFVDELGFLKKFQPNGACKRHIRATCPMHDNSCEHTDAYMDKHQIEKNME